MNFIVREIGNESIPMHKEKSRESEVIVNPIDGEGVTVVDNSINDQEW